MTASQQAATGLADYQRLTFLRAFLKKVDSLYRQGLAHGPVHLGLGQEAIAIGAASVLRPDDYSLGTYRRHAHALARGAPPDAILGELLGRAGGICAGKGSQHGQSAENWAICVPGLKIVPPAGPTEAFGLLPAAIRDDDPVLVFEYKALYGQKEEIADSEQALPLGRARTVRPGTDVTLVGLSITVQACLAAADELAGAGIGAEVIDLRTLVPLDAAAVLDSVRRTSRLVIAEENPGQLGWGAAIAAIAAEEAFGHLAAPVRRVSGGNVPLPVAAPMEAEVDVTPQRIAAAVRAVVSSGRP